MRSKNAYFTVEATLVLPLVMGAIFFTVFLLLFQYNRCLLEQDMGALAMWGSMLQGDGEVLAREIEKRIEDIYREKYFAWEETKLGLEIKYNTVVVSASGRVEFPLPGWNFWNDENVWDAEAEWRSQRLQPVEFVRMCNKLGESRGE